MKTWQVNSEGSSDTELETIKCKSCGAPARPYNERCDYCGSYFVEHEEYVESDYDAESYTRSFAFGTTTMSMLPLGWAISMSAPHPYRENRRL
jgi:uncharacterized OB-fold protein